MIKITNYIFRLDPDIYLAENMGDYRENAPKIKIPFIQKIISIPRIYISINNVCIERLKVKDYIVPNYFKVHDDTGEDIMIWDKGNPLFSALHSFEEVQEKQFLKDKDWIQELFFRYYLNYDFPSIVEVNKYKKRYFQKEPIRKLEEAFQFH